MPEYALQGNAGMGVSLFDVFTADCVTLCVVMDTTCALMFVLESVRLKESVPLLRRSEAGSWLKLKGMTVTFGQNQEQRVFCRYCFLHILSSQPDFLSLLYLFLPSALQNSAAKKKTRA